MKTTYLVTVDGKFFVIESFESEDEGKAKEKFDEFWDRYNNSGKYTVKLFKVTREELLSVELPKAQ